MFRESDGMRLSTAALLSMVALAIALCSCGQVSQRREEAPVWLKYQYYTTDCTHQVLFTGLREPTTVDGGIKVKGSFLAENDTGMLRRLWFAATVSPDDARRSKDDAISLDQCRDVTISAYGPISSCVRPVPKTDRTKNDAGKAEAS